MNIRKLSAAALAAALALALPAASEDFARHVNPSVGCAFNGHCFAAAAYPFGLVQAGPDTGNFSWNYTSGYRDADTNILGFSQTHLSGTGCPDLGDILVMPYVCTDLSQPQLPISAHQYVSFSLVQGGHLSHGTNTCY